MVAVVGAFELEDLAAPGKGARQAHGVGGGFRAGGCIGDFFGAGYVVDEAFGKRNCDIVERAEHVRAAFKLGLCCLDYSRV